MSFIITTLISFCITALCAYFVYRFVKDKVMPPTRCDTIKQNVWSNVENLPPMMSCSASMIALKIRNGEWTSVSVVETFISHVKKVNTSLNAVVAERYDLAIEEAKQVDEAIATWDEAFHGPLPPFFGVPMFSKECFAMQGLPHTSGLVSRKDLRNPNKPNEVNKTKALYSSPVLQNLQRAGFIILGTTNTSELCMWMESSNKVYGQTNNPYDLSRTPGGSSGGAASITAAAGPPVVLGSDVGGSIRMPCFFNGLYGHKPTGGIASVEGQWPPSTGLLEKYCQPGPICRYPADLWPVLQIMSGAFVGGMTGIAGSRPSQKYITTTSASSMDGFLNQGPIKTEGAENGVGNGTSTAFTGHVTTMPLCIPDSQSLRSLVSLVTSKNGVSTPSTITATAATTATTTASSTATLLDVEPTLGKRNLSNVYEKLPLAKLLYGDVFLPEPLPVSVTSPVVVGEESVTTPRKSVSTSVSSSSSSSSSLSSSSYVSSGDLYGLKPSKKRIPVRSLHRNVLLSSEKASHHSQFLKLVTDAVEKQAEVDKQAEVEKQTEVECTTDKGADNDVGDNDDNVEKKTSDCSENSQVHVSTPKSTLPVSNSLPVSITSIFTQYEQNSLGLSLYDDKKVQVQETSCSPSPSTVTPAIPSEDTLTTGLTSLLEQCNPLMTDLSKLTVYVMEGFGIDPEYDDLDENGLLSEPSTISVKKKDVETSKYKEPPFSFASFPPTTRVSRELIAVQRQAAAFLKSHGATVQRIHITEFEQAFDIWSSCIGSEGPSFRELLLQGSNVPFISPIKDDTMINTFLRTQAAKLGVGSNSSSTSSSSPSHSSSPSPSSSTTEKVLESTPVSTSYDLFTVEGVVNIARFCVQEAFLTMYVFYQLILCAVAPQKCPYTVPALLLALVETIPKLTPGKTRSMIAKGAELSRKLDHILTGRLVPVHSSCDGGSGIGNGNDNNNNRKPTVLSSWKSVSDDERDGDKQYVMLFPAHTVTARKHTKPFFAPLDWIYTGIFNALQSPVTSIPCGLGPDSGMPTGFQIVGAKGYDWLTIGVAMALHLKFPGWIPPPSMYSLSPEENLENRQILHGLKEDKSSDYMIFKMY